MDSLAGYGSDDENENERYYNYQPGSSGAHGAHRRRDDDTNYDDVNMDLSEDSQAESEPELPPAEPAPKHHHGTNNSNENRERDRERDRDREPEKRGPRGEPSPRPRAERDRDRRPSPRRDDRYRSERDRSRGNYDQRETGSARRGLLGDRPDDKHQEAKVPALMDIKPFGGEGPPPYSRSGDARDAVSPRFVDRERDRGRERDRDNRRDRDADRGRERDGDRRDRDGERGREKDRRDRYSEERRSSSRHDRERSRSRPGAAFPPPSSSTERRVSPPSGDYRPSSYKVNKKLEVMEKMGLQIKTPDGSMATAQQLRAAAGEAPTIPAGGLPSYYNPSAVNTNKILDQVQKRKLLWSNKNKREAEEAAKWSGTRFAQDTDGKQVSKFMRLMGIKEPAAVKPESTEKTADPIKKQEELFQAMQAQYEVARATTHTMRGVGLGFQRGGQF